MLNETTYDKNRKRAIRRKNNVKKAIRKREITRNVYQKSDWDDWEYYKNLHPTLWAGSSDFYKSREECPV